MSRIEEALRKAAEKRSGGGARNSDPHISTQKLAEISEADTKGQLRADPELLHENPMLVMINDPASAIAEEYRKLKAVVSQLTKGERFRNTILVTSAIPEEGKSLTSLNLAISLAKEQDHTVLLVDADLRRPSVHKYLGMSNGTGLSDCLTDEIPLSQAIVPTNIEKLSIIRAGHSVDSPVELFSSQQMKELVEDLKNRYSDRYVIIDSPPLLPFAESRFISKLVDGVILVVKEEFTPLASIHDAVAALDGSDILGIVYNDAEIHRFDSRYHYYRSYTYNRKGNPE